MTKREFMSKIGLSEAQQDIVLRCRPEQYERLKELFYFDFAAFLAKMRGARDLSCKQCLSLYTDMAYELAAEYGKREISDEIYINTFSDIGVWARMCLAETGEEGLRELEWLRRHLYLEVFRLGRLQFEFKPAEFAFSCGGEYIAVGDEIVFVHIPSGGELSVSACESAYRKAAEFYGRNRLVFICWSWLLSPTLLEYLDETGNIAQFASRYTLLWTEDESDSAERYVPLNNESSLSRAVVSLKSAGKHVGEGIGAFIYYVGGDRL